MGKRYILATITFGLSLCPVFGMNIDSLIRKVPNFNFYVIPTFSHQLETGNVYGLNGAYFFRFLDSTRISNISFSQVFAERIYSTTNISPHLYIGNNGKLGLFANIYINNYPSAFFGTGNSKKDLLTDPIPYTARSFALSVQLQRFVNKYFAFGFQFALREERAVIADSLKCRVANYQLTGWNPYFLLGLGVGFTYDTRNSLFYPTKGYYVSGGMFYYSPLWGSSYNIVQFNYDFRHYIPLYKQHVFAWQFLTDWRLGNKIPFQMLTTVGGDNMLRGVAADYYRDNVMAAVQGEYRFPIYKILRGALFGATGDVFNSRNFYVNRLKVAYGAGLRFRFTRGKIDVNGRLDVTRNNYDKGVQYFFTAMEAF